MWKKISIAAVLSGCAWVTEVDHQERIDVDGDGLVAAGYPGGTDCDDRDGAVGAASRWYADEDGDGAGDPAVETAACAAPSGYVANADDCDDRDGDIHPGAEERCNGLDDDCDGTPDDGLPLDVAWQDADGDGYGSEAVFLGFCVPPPGWVPNDDDCDDADSDIAPGTPELCDGVDQDCDGLIDEGLALSTWYPDVDGDGFGDDAGGTEACVAPAGFVAEGGDCNDRDAEVSPGGREVCDGVDQDCDGTADNGLPRLSWHPDEDGDGYGDPAETVVDCAAPDGWVDPAGDCDDTDALVFPDADERCNGLDDDCDGVVDDGLPGTRPFYEDADGDGYGVAATEMVACQAAAGWTDVPGDCDDTDDAVSPDAAEVCGDLVDQDCDGARPQCGPFGDLSAGRVAYLRPEDTAYEAGAAIAGWVAGATPWVAVGAPELVVNGEGSVGGVYVLASPVAPGLYPVAGGALLVGDRSNRRFGAALAAGPLDDVPGADLVVGAPADSSGRVFVYSGPTFAGTYTVDDAIGEIKSQNGFEGLGASLALGDLTGSATVDLVMGAPHGEWDGDDGSGAVAIVDPTSSIDGKVTDRAFRIVTGRSAEELGASVAVLADFDGDGVGDLAIGAPGRDSDAGAVYITLGPIAPGSGRIDAFRDVVWTGPEDARAGVAVAGADVDDDGRADLLVGAPDLSEGGVAGRGGVFLIHGTATPSDGDLGGLSRLLGETADSGLGASVAAAGDTDGDGVEEVLVGAPRVANARGRAFLWAPPPSGVTVTDMVAELPPRHVDHRVGASVAPAGDIDGDGFDDIWIGASGARPFGTQEGAASLVFGAAP